MRHLGLSLLFAAAVWLVAAAPDAGTRKAPNITFEICDAAFCGDEAMNARYRSESPNLAFDDRPLPPPPDKTPKIARDGAQLEVKVGATLYVRAGCVVQRAAFGNHPYDLRIAGGDVVYLTGLFEGSAPVLLWCTNGKRVQYTIDVKP